MSNLAEIQDAIISLPEAERAALSVWFASQSQPVIAPEDERQLLDSLDRAMRDLDGGKRTSLNDARKLVRSWAGR